LTAPTQGMFSNPRAPLASVVIPVFNGERFLAAAIESVLDQTYRPLEVIVVDDGSTDASAAVASSFPCVRVVAQCNAGPASARNRGVATANGQFLAFLDADDVAPADKLEVQVGYLRDHPEVGCVLGRQELLLDPGVDTPLWAGIPSELARRRPDIAKHGLVPYMSMVVRASLFEKVGVFDTNYVHGEDADWLLRARRHAAVATLDSVVLRRRIHAGNLSNDLRALRHGSLRALKDHARRLRAGG
jgi:glycosyltransferase involved in cell wall biosynthesis